MKTFEDFEETVLKPSPICQNPEAGKPEVGTIGERDVLGGPGETHPYKERKKILRVKAISAQEITKLALSNEDVAANLWFKQHDSKPFIMWLIEVEP